MSQRRARVALRTAIAGVLVAFLGTGCGTAASELTPTALGWTRGPIPESAWLADGTIDRSQVPDFIPATDGDATVGWVASADVLPPPGQPRPEVVTVFGDDLVTVVGHMYPDAGFVALGAEPLVLSPDRDRDLTILVRNESAEAAILEITEARDEVNRRPRLIAPPIIVEAGEERPVRFQSPVDRWSLNLRGDPGFFYSDDLGPASRGPGFSLLVTREGTMKMSTTP